MQPLCVAIRADASPRIGLGHVKRCLSLAQALLGAGAKICLVARDLGVDIRALARSYDVEVELLAPPQQSVPAATEIPHAHWAEVTWQQDVADTVFALARRAVDWIVVDHYAFDARWHEAMRRQLGVPIAVVDDLADRNLSAELLVDQNHAADHRRKYQGRIASSARILGGPRFALLSSAYRSAARYELNVTCRSLGIFMGGIDAANWSSVALRACRDQAGFDGDIAIATTSANPNIAELRALCERWPRTTLEVDLADLSGFFARHDLQIGAGGGATWERCCIGPPTLAFVCAENQRVVIDELRELGAIATLPPTVEPSEQSIGAALRRLLSDADERRHISARARALVDGRGAERVAFYMAAARLQLRDASIADAALMFDWRNHPATRQMSVDPVRIEWEAHCRWLERALSDPARILQIATIGALPVGVIRYDIRDGERAEVSLYLDPCLHGLGLGARLLRAGESLLRTRRPGLQQLLATVLDINRASARMFTADGYVRSDDGRYLKALKR